MQNETIMLEQVNEATNTFKAYQVVLEQKADGWSVTGYNGRIGSTLKPQPKLSGASYDEAKKSFDDLVKSKIKGKYKPTQDAGVEMVSTMGIESRTVHDHLVPMRPTRFDVEDIGKLNPAEWMVQEKHDGEGRPLEVSGEITGTNIHGQAAALRASVRDQLVMLRAQTGDLIIDAEDMGQNGIVVFDIRSGLGITPDAPFGRRNEALKRLAEIATEMNLDLVMVEIAEPMASFLARNGEAALRKAVAEGMVLKRVSAPYTPGRGANAKTAATLKAKFTEDATVRVAPSRAADKRSVGIESYNVATGEWVDRGNVTIPGNAPMPAVGDLIDVNYLYITGAKGALIQSVYKKPRPEAVIEDCDCAKLKMKRGTAVAEPEPDMEDDGPTI